MATYGPWSVSSEFESYDSNLFFFLEPDPLNGTSGWLPETDNSTSCENSTGTGCSRVGRQYWTVVLVLFPVFTVFGNVLVCMSVYREKSLQHVTNYFIVSLATADIMVAMLVMPFAVYVEVYNGEWVMGDAFCDAWVACDVMCCTASILNLTAISVDRFIAVTQPIKYAKHKNSRRVHVMLALTWVISIAISSPIALGMNYTDRRAQSPTLCTFYNSDFLIFSSMGSFYIPSIIMILLYWRIFRAIRLRARKSSAAKKPTNQRPIPWCCVGRAGATGSRSLRTASSGYFTGNHVTDDRRAEEEAEEELNAGGEFGNLEGGRAGGCVDRAPTPIAEETGLEEPDLCDGGRRRLEPDLCDGSRGRLERPRRLRTGSAVNGDTTTTTTTNHPGCEFHHAYEFHHPGCGFTDSAIVKDAPASVFDSGADLSPDRIVYTVSGSIATAMTSDGTLTPHGVLTQSQTVDSRYGFLTPSTPPSPVRDRVSLATLPSSISASDYLYSRKFGPEEDRRRKNSNKNNVGRRHGHRKHSSKFDLRLPPKAVKTKKEKSANRRERKATKTLAIVLGVFLLCWVPFFTINIVNAVCIRYDLFTYQSICQIHPMLFSFFVWLGYMNSFLNPVIYTIFNIEFRRAFKKILCQPCR